MEPLISASVPLSEAAQAIRNLKEREGDPMKVQIVQ
jgi:hypothetical protein